MKLLFADSILDSTLSDLRAQGHECDLDAKLSASDLPTRIAGYDGLVVRSTKVNRDVFAAADRLGLVVRAGAGTNTIDTEAAAEHGVMVANVPGRNATAVAELALGLLLAVDRRIPDNVADLRRGTWNKSRYSKADGVMGKTMGVLGLGSIGLGVAERASAFGIRIQVLDSPRRTASTRARLDQLGATVLGSQDELLSSSDIITLHLPSTKQTRGMVDADFLAKLKDDAILLNTSRGELIDETALLAALDATGLRVGLDVYADEPGVGSTEWSSPLAQHPRVVGTHHIGASTQQAQQAIADGVVEIVESFAGGNVRNCVNLAPRGLGAATLTIRHHDKVGVLAGVLDHLSTHGLNVEHMQNRVLAGGRTAVATIDVAGSVTEQVTDGIAAIPHVLGVSVATLVGEGA